MEDLPGNFLLLPPGRSNAGVDAGTADYLGVYSAVTVGASDCRPEPMPGVGMNPSAIVEALRSRTGLKTTTPRKVAVGGLSGLVIDIQMAPGTKTRCSAPNIGGIIPLIIGVGPAELEHAQFPKLRTRLYLLADGDSNVVVEVSDVPTDAPFTDYESVVQEFRFSPES